MINTLQILNFLSHKHSDIGFSPGVNIIVGPTDSGKSAIIRALRWAITNRPTGDSFRSNWGGDTEVIVELSDGYEVTRGKGEEGNFYDLNGDKFKAFSSSIPEEIEKAINLNHINLQTQFDPHFLLSRSAGEVASHFNKVAHLDKIDVGLQNIQKWLRKVQQDITYNEAQVEELTEELQEYEDIDDIERLVSRAELAEVALSDLDIGLDKLNTLCIDIPKINEEIVGLEITTSAVVLVDLALDYIKQGEIASTRLSSLNKTVEELFKIDVEVNELKELLPIEKQVDRALQIEEEINTIGLNRLLELEISLTGISEASAGVKLRQQFKEKQFHENIGEVCPLCETILK